LLKRLKKHALILMSMLLLCACGTNDETKVLVFTKTAGFRHASIEAGVIALQKLGEENGFMVDTTENADMIKEELLKDYAAVVFLNTTGDILNHIQQADFERYIQSGGGFVGIHSAADTEYDWIWYGRMLGAYFNGIRSLGIMTTTVAVHFILEVGTRKNPFLKICFCSICWVESNTLLEITNAIIPKRDFIEYQRKIDL